MSIENPRQSVEEMQAELALLQRALKLAKQQQEEAQSRYAGYRQNDPGFIGMPPEQTDANRKITKLEKMIAELEAAIDSLKNPKLTGKSSRKNYSNR